MTQNTAQRIRDLDGLTVVRMFRHVGSTLFKDPEIRKLVDGVALPAELREFLALDLEHKRELLASDRSIQIARMLLLALAEQQRFAAVVAGALDSFRTDELAVEASIPRGLATAVIGVLASARAAGDRADPGAAMRLPASDPLFELARYAVSRGTEHASRAAPPLAAAGPPKNASPPASALCLNAWFPDRPACDARLLVGAVARLLVNLGPPRAGAAESQVLASAVVHALRELPYVDVLVLCAGADVNPPCRRLVMPPDPVQVLEFTLVPRRPGALDIHVVLLIRNEPIHRMRFPMTAIASFDAPEP